MNAPDPRGLLRSRYPPCFLGEAPNTLRGGHGIDRLHDGAVHSPASTTLVQRRQLELCILPSLRLGVVAGGLWETRSVFQGVWEGAGWRGGGAAFHTPAAAGRGDGGLGEEGAMLWKRRSWFTAFLPL